jgi:hypothetical protein
MYVHEKWALRVAAWQASGQNAAEFCKGREFSRWSLRTWARRFDESELRRAPDQAAEAKQMAFARVVRTKRVRGAADERDVAVVQILAVTPLQVIIGGIQIRVDAGFDKENLSALLDVVEARFRTQVAGQ